jgi:SAM-dependent methyltransferase
MSIERLLQHFAGDQPMTILDLGCGKGKLVDWLSAQGHDAWGCDFAGSSVSDFEADLAADDRLRPIQPQPYRLPFDDGMFDCVVSSQVLEHVKDHESTFREIHRVLKPHGISLHTFPSRHVFIEPHVKVPLASVVRNRAWLHFWAWAGIRNPYQAGKPAADVARLNYDYLHAHTHYLTREQLLRHAKRFFVAAFREDIFFLPGAEETKQRSLKKRLFVLLGGDRLRIRLYGTFVMRALYLRKQPPSD